MCAAVLSQNVSTQIGRRLRRRALPPQAQRPPTSVSVEIAFFDMGHGDSTMPHRENGFAAFVDAGRSSDSGVPSGPSHRVHGRTRTQRANAKVCVHNYSVRFSSRQQVMRTAHRKLALPSWRYAFQGWRMKREGPCARPELLGRTPLLLLRLHD
jgi:hypothetical protein